MTIVRPWRDTVSMMTLRFGSDCRDPEHGRAAHPVERLHHHVLLVVDELRDEVQSRVTSVGRDEFRELGDRELLVVVADRARAVEDARALALGAFEEVRRVHVLHVERRILAHHHRGELGEPQDVAGALAIPRVVVVEELERLRAPAGTPASHRRSRCSIANRRCPRRASSRIIAMLESL